MIVSVMVFPVLLGERLRRPTTGALVFGMMFTGFERGETQAYALDRPSR